MGQCLGRNICHSSMGNVSNEDLIRFIARSFGIGKSRARSAKILELGSGTGANLWFIAREGHQAYGIDGSKTGVELAYNRIKSECPNSMINLSVGDFTKNLPFEDEFFDAIIDIEATYCNSFEETRSIFKEAARCLKPGGKLFIRTFAAGCFGEGTGEQIGEKLWLCTKGPMGGKGPSRFSSLEDIEAILSKFYAIESVELLSRELCSGDDKGTAIKEYLVTATRVIVH